ncbi:MAG: type II secretion system secretin GspD [Thermodesulfobacteriota bacterium]
MIFPGKIQTCFWLLALGLLLWPVAPLSAGEKDRITVNFQDVDISSVINSVSKITGRTFIVDPKVKGKVTIVASQDVPEKELYSIFLSILQVHNYAAIETNGITKIVPMDRAKHDSRKVSSGRDKTSAPPDSVITRLYKLNHIPADRLVAILRPLVPGKSYLAAEPQSNMLIISDRKAGVDRLVKIIDKIDQARSGEIEVIRLEHADAGDIVRVIEGLEGRQRPKGAPNVLRLIADERTNCVLLSGSEYELIRLRTLISHLDTPIDNEGSTRVVFLSYARAKDLLPILSGSEPVAQGQKGKVVAKKGSPGFNIQADEATNALVITAPPAVMKSLLAVVRKLDIRRTQVMIEAVIAEISTGDGAELGIQWRSTDITSSGENGVIGGTNFNTTSGGPNINLLSADPLGIAGLGGGLGTLSGFNLGYIKGSADILGTEILNLGALVTALSTDADTNILSTPSLVTMDNEEAEIVVGNNVPFATGTYTGVGGQTSDIQNPFTTYDRQDVGLKLKVTPQINKGDTIRLDIEQEVSNISPSSSTVVGLQTTTTRLFRTSVMVDDSKILVLGGLISDDIQETVQKVPLLGSIPILGWLFRYTKSVHNKRNLMVFLRPTIIRDSATGNRITFDKYDYMRRLQMERRDEGVALLPGSEPPVMPEDAGLMEQ